ncbi:MAG TPA: hypothetical protein DD726_03290, partial [Phycisphaerales bacterium]|nr:hypothetical protein [Phycisphaerales bacterium]
SKTVNGYNFTTGCLPIVGDDTAYAQKFTLASGVYMDLYRPSENYTWHYDPNEFYLNYFPPAEFERALRYATSIADEYAWVYSGSVFWRNSHGWRDVPIAYDDAARAALAVAMQDPVVISDAGNAADTRGVTYNSQTLYIGEVGYTYQIGRNEVTNAQYCEFLNVVAASDPYGLYNTYMADANHPNRGGITRTGSSGNYKYSAIADRENLPVNWLTWRSAARMANWLHNGRQSDPDTTEYGAYDASTFTGTGCDKNDQSYHYSDAKYWIPRIDEWYKAAFYKGGSTNAGYWTYATKSDTAPAPGPLNSAANKANYQADNYDFGEGVDYGDMTDVGNYTLSPGVYGTLDMNGNIYEFIEYWAPGETGCYRVLYGGAWKWNDTEQLRYDGFGHASPDAGYYERGFRLASELPMIMFQASKQSPANVATDVSIATTLSWASGDYSTSHDVYFGTNKTSVTNANHASGEYKGNQAGTTYAPGTLINNTTYYWRIDEVGPDGTTEGDVWNFTTIDPPVPTFVAAGSVASGTGTITPAFPAGIATGDILLLFLETSNQAISISNQNGGTWTAVANSPQGTGTAAGTTGARLTAFWSRYNGTQGAPTTSDSGDHQLGRMIAIRGAVSSGNPWDVTAGGVEAVSDTSGSIPGATTTVGNTLVVTAIATSLPDASSTAKFSAWTNANLTSVTERIDNSVTAGNGGGLAVATGIRATTGAYGNTAVTLVNAAYKGMMSIAIKP